VRRGCGPANSGTDFVLKHGHYFAWGTVSFVAILAKTGFEIGFGIQPNTGARAGSRLGTVSRVDIGPGASGPAIIRVGGW